MEKQIFKKQTFTEQMAIETVATGLEYLFEDKNASVVDNNINTKLLLSGKKDEILKQVKNGEISKDQFEQHNFTKEQIKAIENKFKGLDLVDPTPEELQKRQEQYATSTVIYAQVKPKEFNSLMEEVIDPYTSKQKTQENSQVQKIKLGFALDLETFKKIKQKIAEAQFLKFDLSEGMTTLWHTPNGNWGYSVFAKYMIDSSGQKIALERSKNSIFNKNKGLIIDTLFQVNSTDTSSQQVKQEQKGK